MAESTHPSNLDAADPERGEALWWHAGWATTLVTVSAALWIGLGRLDLSIVSALLLGLAPAAAVLLLRPPRGAMLRTGLLIGWSIAMSGACILTGGVSGPLTVWCLAPVGAAAVLGGARPVAQGAALALGAVAMSALAQALGAAPEPPQGMAAFGLGLLSAATTSVGLGVALVLSRRRLTASSHAQVLAAADLTLILENQPSFIVVVDEAGAVLASFGQPPAGLSPEVPRAEGLLSLTDPAARSALQKTLTTVAHGGRSEALILPLAGADDAYLSVQPRMLDGRRLVVTITDFTDQHRRQAALEIARQDAESLNIGKSRFLANMSHELRTPLNAIMGFSDIMRQRMFGSLPGKYAEYADLIHDAGGHLLDLINDVLDMSKIEAHRYDLTKEPLDAREPVSAALRLMRLQADDAGVQLRALLPAQPLELEADRRALKQIGLNLISNALKFTPRGGLVTVSLQRLAGALEFSVTDNGMGISESDLRRIGRPFEQGGDAGQKVRGTGLGLSLVRAFAELHGGEMAIESRLGEGTSVTVRLPGLLEPQATAPVAVPAPVKSAEVIAFPG